MNKAYGTASLFVAYLADGEDKTLEIELPCGNISFDIIGSTISVSDTGNMTIPDKVSYHVRWSALAANCEKIYAEYGTGISYSLQDGPNTFGGNLLAPNRGENLVVEHVENIDVPGTAFWKLQFSEVDDKTCCVDSLQVVIPWPDCPGNMQYLMYGKAFLQIKQLCDQKKWNVETAHSYNSLMLRLHDGERESGNNESITTKTMRRELHELESNMAICAEKQANVYLNPDDLYVLRKHTEQCMEQLKLELDHAVSCKESLECAIEALEREKSYLAEKRSSE